METGERTDLRRVPGIGETRGKRLEKLGLTTLDQVLDYFPRSYEDRTKRSAISGAPEGEKVCVEAMVAAPPRLSRIRQGLELVKVEAVDASGRMTVTFFNQSYLRTSLREGESCLFFGAVEGTGRRRTMTNPLVEKVGENRSTGRIVPLYPLTAGISNNLIAGLARRALENCLGEREESLPLSVRRTHHLCTREYAYRNIHFPGSWEELETARRRLGFEELFSLACGMALLRRFRDRGEGPRLPQGGLEEFEALLPFSLTAAQRRSIREAAADMASGRPMNRLVQGDVGSGKTMVAAACAFLAFRGGWQSALMAPTEILAEQHYRSLAPLLERAGMRLGLLTGSVRASRRRELLEALAGGELHLLLGTHALLSEGVDFHRLGVVIADEQHRFGVAQRAALSAKGSGITPHVLVMSATPIPRTLALMIYGDLDLSVIDELPPGRKAVKTFLIGEDKRERLYGFIRKLAAQGRQSYIVCPAVEEGEEGAAELKAATEYAAELGGKVFPDLRVALVHGRMKAGEKDRVMTAFAAGEIDVLVSTTVIEVGVDVPNAALMVVENAERFGLSQLHQLRGRVGRGGEQSWCVLMAGGCRGESLERLKILAGTNDGFRIAEEDLRLRGPGDFFGKRQHGLPELRAAGFGGDARLLREAQDAAQALLEADPELREEENAPLRRRVEALFAENPDGWN